MLPFMACCLLLVSNCNDGGSPVSDMDGIKKPLLFIYCIDLSPHRIDFILCIFLGATSKVEMINGKENDALVF